MALSTIELFAGVGMLGEGVAAGFESLGIEHRTVCYVEREAYAASVLVARMQEGSLAQAPIWSDVTTFNASQFAGKVDGIVAGFPCQDLSIAGARAGLDGARSGLFFEIPKIADACGAWFLFLENVAAIASATAATVDETEGCLEERAAARVLGELADCGWDAEWITLSASDVGASHGRARWFCFAWRLDDTMRAKRWPGCHFRAGQQQGHYSRRHQKNCWPGISNQTLGYTGLQHLDLQQWEIWAEHQAASNTVADTKGKRNEAKRMCSGSCSEQSSTNSGGISMADAYWQRSQNSKQPGKPGQEEYWDAAWAAIAQLRDVCLADTYGTGFRELWLCESRTSDTVPGNLELFAPGPTDARWKNILSERPELSPALESTFCDLVNGLAYHMDDSRAARLRCVGNGVVALCAAAALVLLVRRSEIFK